MADQKHEHGTMDIEVQEKTFASFATLISKSIVAIVIGLLLLYVVNG